MKQVQLWACVAISALLFACERTVTYEETVAQPATCFNCHSDQDTRLVAAEQQYAFSVHASGTAVSEPNDPCSGCHTSEGFVSRIETGTLPDPATLTQPTAINCFTCHKPHTSGTLERRVKDPVTLKNGTVSNDFNNGNICVACHQARRDVGVYVSGRVTMSRRWGPHHSVQGDMLNGTNGYEYASYTYEQTEHRLALNKDNGKDGCLECHYKVTENLRVGGHSFNMTYDEDGDGVEDMFNTGACEPCHGDIGDDFDYYGAQTDTQALAAQLRTLLVAGGLWDDVNNYPKSITTSADSAGAVWNYLMVEEDRSEGIHNKLYMQSLLQSAINFLQPPTSAPVAAKREDVQGGSR